jgi:hypothetical protein
MRKTKEVLRLHFEAGLSERQISKISVLGKGTVRRFLRRAEAAGLSWPLPPSLDDAGLEKKLFPPPPPPSAGQRPQPDYATIRRRCSQIAQTFPRLAGQFLLDTASFERQRPSTCNQHWLPGSCESLVTDCTDLQLPSANPAAKRRHNSGSRPPTQ